MVPENSLCVSPASPSVEVLYGWQVRPGDALCSFHDPLQSFAATVHSCILFSMTFGSYRETVKDPPVDGDQGVGDHW